VLLAVNTFVGAQPTLNHGSAHQQPVLADAIGGEVLTSNRYSPVLLAVNTLNHGSAHQQPVLADAIGGEVLTSNRYSPVLLAMNTFNQKYSDAK